jgi:hypothetical protein
LRRNPVYLRLILDFLATQAGASGYVAEKDASPALLRAKLLDARIEMGQVQNVLACIQRGEALRSANEAEPIPRLSESAAYAAFSDTVWVLRALLERLNADGVVYEVDIEKCEVRDLAAAPGRRVVIAGVRLRPFMEAYVKLLRQEGLRGQ